MQTGHTKNNECKNIQKENNSHWAAFGQSAAWPWPSAPAVAMCTSSNSERPISWDAIPYIFKDAMRGGVGWGRFETKVRHIPRHVLNNLEICVLV